MNDLDQDLLIKAAHIAELETSLMVCSDANNVQADRAKTLRERIAELEKALIHVNDLCYNSNNNADAVEAIEELLAPICAAMERKE